MIENMPAHDKTLFDLILKPGLKKKSILPTRVHNRLNRALFRVIDK